MINSLRRLFCPLSTVCIQDSKGGYSAVALEKIEKKIVTLYPETGRREEFVSFAPLW